MTRQLSGHELAEHVRDAAAKAAEVWNDLDVVIRSEYLVDVCSYLKEAQGLEFNYLNTISAVDYVEYFEVVYHLSSTIHNHSATLKTRVYSRDEASVPSVVDIWHGADLQEREVWDLMGIQFTGHPNLKRVLLWEGFPGHPLRKDFLEQIR
jgi:NADH-quinone oxidoreductase subunit C